MRFSQFHSGLAAAGIDLQIQSLLDDAYLERSFSGGRPSLRNSCWQPMDAVSSGLATDSCFDLAIVYGDLLPFLPGWLERQLLQIPFVYDFDDAFFS